MKAAAVTAEASAEALPGVGDARERIRKQGAQTKNAPPPFSN